MLIRFRVLNFVAFACVKIPFCLEPRCALWRRRAEYFLSLLV
jgi:hypothetical protein